MFKKNNAWYSDIRRDGERFIRSHGPVSKTVAKEMDAKFRAEIAAGTCQKKGENPAFDRALQDHIERSKTSKQPSSIKRDWLSAGHLIGFFGDRKIDQIENNQILITQYIKQRMETVKTKQIGAGRVEAEVTYTTINRELALLRTLFNQLIKTGKINKNPVRLIKMFPEIQKERILSEEEEVLIFEAFESAGPRYAHLKDMVTIAIYTGAREGEIMGLKKAWVDLDQGVIVVPKNAQKVKTKDKRIPISSAIRPVLERRLAIKPENPYVFVNPKTDTRYTVIQHSWNAILKKAGLHGRANVDKLRFHDLRHTAATRLAGSGLNMKIVAQFLGHVDMKTSARYIHPTDGDMMEAAELLAKVPSPCQPTSAKSSVNQKNGLRNVA